MTHPKKEPRWAAASLPSPALCPCVCQCLFSGCCRLWLSPKLLTASPAWQCHPCPPLQFVMLLQEILTWHCSRLVLHWELPFAQNNLAFTGPWCRWSWVLSYFCVPGLLSWGFPLRIQLWDAPGAAEPSCVGINHQTQHSHCQAWLQVAWRKPQISCEQ